MKNGKRKVVILSLSCLFTMGLLCSCGGADTPQAASSENSVAESTVETQAETTAETEPEDTGNYENYRDYIKKLVSSKKSY